MISIHALVKRATQVQASKAQKKLISIHALVKRATVVKTLVTHLVDNFNPRPREEGDTKSTTFPSTKPISIHALVKRATNFCTVTGNRLIISIHALVKRATTELLLC